MTPQEKLGWKFTVSMWLLFASGATLVLVVLGSVAVFFYTHPEWIAPALLIAVLSAAIYAGFKYRQPGDDDGIDY